MRKTALDVKVIGRKKNETEKREKADGVTLRSRFRGIGLFGSQSRVPLEIRVGSPPL